MALRSGLSGTRLDRDADVPLWRQLAAVLRRSIQDGTFQADAALPSESELISYYAVSRTVVREALAELVREQLVYRVRAKGTFVMPTPSDIRFIGGMGGSEGDLRGHGLNVVTKVLDLTVSVTSEHEAAVLELEPGDPVVRLRRLRFASGAPLLVSDTVLPSKLVPGIERTHLENRSLYEFLRRHYGLEPAGADRWLRASLPTAEEAVLLQIDAYTPLLDIESIAWNAEGVRFEYYRARHRSDEYRFYVGIR